MSIKASIVQPRNIRVKQAIVDASTLNIGSKEINELSDVNAEKTDGGIMVYDEDQEVWVTTTNLDGGTF